MRGEILLCPRKLALTHSKRTDRRTERETDVVNRERCVKKKKKKTGRGTESQTI